MWSNHQEAPIMTRLDRFLVSNDWLELYPKVCQIALPNSASNHWPLLLDSCMKRWGPAPFRFELMWLEEKELRILIKEWCKEIKVKGWEGHKLFVKLKLLKHKIRDWAKVHFRNVGGRKRSALKKFNSLIPWKSQRGS